MKAFSISSPKSILTKEALRDAVMQLQAVRIETASLDARILLEHVLGVSREKLLLMLEEPLSDLHVTLYHSLIEERAKHRPVSQLMGKREFWGMEFKVTPDTLDPRPDSETLIEVVLKRVADRQAPLSILDLGTGTGCLLLSLLSELPNARGVAVDLSPQALAVAQENALAHGLRARTQCVQSRWAEQVTGLFDIIISNPPYIPTADIAALAPEVAQYEPLLALDGGEDGLVCYREIMKAVPDLLAPHGIAVFEIGFGQQTALETIATEHGLTLEMAKQDMQSIVRCMLFSRNLQE
ncbi:MAG: peptide chain release factor N(5)-glutamine methyltransferase [Rickettsiales bacterium]|nr:peptide chain release factor N(5)-glutamine methyltransferase [Rickettsiales bacterium]